LEKKVLVFLALAYRHKATKLRPYLVDRVASFFINYRKNSKIAIEI